MTKMSGHDKKFKSAVLVKNTGLHAYRYKDNPVEEMFAQAWQDEIDSNGGGTLSWLLGPGNRRADVSPEQAKVACTVVQWLGSPVGMNFLRGVKDHAKKTAEAHTANCYCAVCEFARL